MRSTPILSMPYCKHRVFEDKCSYCNGEWKEVFCHDLEYHCLTHCNIALFREFETLKERSRILAVRRDEIYVNSELQYILKCFQNIKLYDFNSLYRLAIDTKRSLLDIIYIQESYKNKTKEKYFNLKLRFLEKLLKNKEGIKCIS